MKWGVIRIGENPPANLFSWPPSFVCTVGRWSWAIWKLWTHYQQKTWICNCI